MRLPIHILALSSLAVLPAFGGAGEEPAAGHSYPAWQALPLNLSLLSLVSRLAPAGADHPPDFGGLAEARLPSFGLEAGSWTRTAYQLNGVNLGDPYAPGRPLFLADLDTADRILVRQSVAVLTRTGQRDWRGRLESEFTSRALASNNLTALAVRAGLLRPERFRWYTRDRLELSGGVGRHADLFLSGAGRWAGQSLPRDPLQPELRTRLLTASAAAMIRAGVRDRLRAAFTGSRIDLAGFGAPAGFEALTARRMAPPFEFHPLQREEDHLDHTQLAWLRENGAPSRLELRYGYAVGHLDTATPPFGPGREPQIDLGTGALMRNPPIANLAVRSRHAFGVVLSRSRQSVRLWAQFDWQRASFRNRLTAPGDLHILTLDGRPVSLVELNTPLDSRGLMTELSPSLGAGWELSPWLALSGGVAFEAARGSLPAQTSPAGTFRPARRFEARPNLLAWNDAAPWAGLRLLPARSPVSLRGSWRRSLQPVAGRYLDYGNPNSLSGLEYRATDRRLWRRFGGEYTQIDPAIRRPYTDEFAVEARAALPGSATGRLRLFRRDDRRRLAAVNVGVPFEAYRPVGFLDPGGDAVAGTPDDQRLVVWDQEPATFGQDRFLLTNARLGSFSAGLVAELALSHSRCWWRLSFAAGKGYATTNPGNAPWENDAGVVGALLADPNTLIHATGRVFFDRAYVGRFYGGARLPGSLGGIELGWVAAYWDGLAFGRRLVVTGLAQGPLVVLATPRGSPEGGHRTKYNLAIDLRLARRFSLPRGRLGLWADLFNLPNVGHAVRERDLTGPEFNLRLPVAIQPPRFVRLGASWEF